MPKESNARPLALVTILFFMWGFLTSMNDILVPFFKDNFTLKLWQANLVQFAFFIAYFAGSLTYYLLSVTQGDPIARIGYKNGISIGLGTAATGAFLFYPAAQLNSFAFFLIALFVLGLGFTLLQISANPFVTILGPEKTASSRLNLSQGFNSLGHTLAPLIGGFLIFEVFAGNGDTGPDAVKIPYLFLGCTLLALSVFFRFVNLPDISGQSHIEKGLGALKYPHVVLGMIAIFMYVGAEISIASNMISFLKEPETAGLPEAEGANYVAIYWGGLMIGRFAGAFTLGEQPLNKKIMGIAISGVGAFFLIWFAINFKGQFMASGGEKPGIDLTEMAPFALMIFLGYVGLWIGKGLPSRTLTVFALLAAVALVGGLLTSGKVAMWLIIGVGLFNSIMWSNIFSLAIAGLGKYKSQAASLLVMMILGGAIFPPIQGLVGDLLKDVHPSFFVPAAAYLYIAFYGWKGHKIKLQTS